MYLCRPLKVPRLLGCCFLFWGRERHNFFSNVPLNQCTQRPMVPMCTEYDSYHLCQNVFWRLYKFETIVRLRLFGKKIKEHSKRRKQCRKQRKEHTWPHGQSFFFGMPTMQMMLYNGLQRTMSYQ